MIMAIPLLITAVAQSVPPRMPPSEDCLTVQDDRIYARDIAAAIPAFSAVAADFSLGYSPLPGARRIFKGAALQKLAWNQGVATDSLPDLCVERAMAALDSRELLDAMRNAWPDPQARIELRSWSPPLAPQGKVVFPRTGLQLPAASDVETEVRWRGYVLYGNNRRYNISAHARITISTTRVVALSDLSTGAPVREDQVRLESIDTFALDDRPARSLDEVVGFVPRTLIRAGAIVLRSQLGRAPEVARGDMVKVEVTAGAARLAFEGRAETDGVVGTTILVKNPSSGKDFRARVTGKGKVSVQ